MNRKHSNGYTRLRSFPNCCILYDSVDNTTSDCCSYKRDFLKTFLYILSCFSTSGFLLLVSYWKPHWHLFMTHSICSLSDATKVLITDQYGCCYVEVIETQPAEIIDDLYERKDIKFVEAKHFENGYKHFSHKKIKFVLSEDNDSFFAVENIGTFDCSLIYKWQNGLHEIERGSLLKWYGHNSVDIQIKSYFILFLEECSDAFYVFQILSCILWFTDNYYYYATAIIIISVTSISISIYQTRQYLTTLRDMIAKSDLVTVLDSTGKEIEVSSDELVPGDILVVPKNGCPLLCDAVLLSGTAIVNESMLTGESVPVTKTPFPHFSDESSLFISSKYKNHILFCGTDILQTRYYANEKVLALVIKTGFTTLKGGLIRSILFPKPVDFKFANDALKFVAVLGILACAGLSYSIYASYINGLNVKELVLKSLDVVTIAVPPALPAAMTVGIVYALKRLKKKNIFCISPSHINISGKIKLFCFDKTGTLTEDGLHFAGVIPSEKMESNNAFEGSLDDHPNTEKLTVAMATCHSLTIIDNQVCGDPLDMQMFNATGWELEEGGSSETSRYGQMISTIVKRPSNSADALKIKFMNEDTLPLEVAILKQFTFSSELQRMSVIVRKLGSSSMEVFVKGSPEIISTLCEAKTIPKYFEDCLHSFSQQGFRILALAYKSLSTKVKYHKLQHFKRSDAESNLTFLGFLVMKNLVKIQTAPTLRKLDNAQIRTVMITGDNLLTAVSVARECAMIKGTEKIITINIDENKELNFSVLGELDEHCDIATTQQGNNFNHYEVNINFLKRNYHFAITGKVFHEIYNSHPQLLLRLLVEGTVFARMLPDQKELLVEQLQNLGYGVGMCGDGANDCGALKRAHAGVSLSETEASIASPFTSKIPDISCVIEVIREGRCALVTAFNIFKYMALYSMIQFASALLLYSIASNLGDKQYLFIDLFLITSFAITIGHAAPATKFVAERPLGRLVHPIVLFSVLAQIAVQITFQVLCYVYVRSLWFYKPPSYFTSGDGDKILSYENTILFTYTNFQYIIVAIIFSVGKPFRQSLHKNKYFFVALIFFVCVSAVFVTVPWKFMLDSFQLLQITDRNYLLTFFGLVSCNFVVSFMIDHVFLRAICFRRCLKYLLCKKGPRNKYKLIMADIEKDSTWPPTGKYRPSDVRIFL